MRVDRVFGGAQFIGCGHGSREPPLWHRPAPPARRRPLPSETGRPGRAVPFRWDVPANGFAERRRLAVYMGQRRRHDVRHRRSHRPRCGWACPSGRVSRYPGSCSCKPGRCVPLLCHATEVQSYRPRPRVRRRPYPFLPFPVFPLHPPLTPAGSYV